jgi:hypothetical protein
MNFEELKDQVWQAQAEYGIELARCHDVYRLCHLCKQLSMKMDMFRQEAAWMVREIEDV